MGYRVRLGKIDKQEVESLRLLSSSQCDEKQKSSNYEWSPYRPEGYTQLYEIGKYFNSKKGREPFYINFDVYKEFEAEFDILTEDGLKAIIEVYREDIEDYYKKLTEFFPKDKESIQEGLVTICMEEEDYIKLTSSIYSKYREWSNKSKFNVLPYYLDEEKTDGAIVKSWKLEYAIFNLVYIYRTFDWENDYLIYSGW